MNFKINVSEYLDESVLRSVYDSSLVLNKAWPNASYPIEMQEWIDWFEKKTSKKHSLTLLVDGCPVGHLVVMTYIDSPFKSYICFVAIKESEQAKGFGRLLMLEAESYSWQKLRIDSMNLIVDPSNISALKLYTSLGYKIVSEGDKLRLSKLLVS